MAERRAAALLGALTVLLAVLWAADYHPFVFPNADYHSFERIAASFAAGEWPSQWKRGPLLPALMALLAPLLPGRHPELHAALLANLAFALGSVGLLYGLVRSLAGPAAAGLVALLLGTSSVHQVMALQPLVEPSLGFAVLLSFALMRSRSPWQYLAAAAAAASRPEALGLAPILALANALAEPERWRRHFGLAAAATVPALLWNGAGALRGSGASAYVDIMDAAGRLAPQFLGYYWSELFAGFARHAPVDLAIAVLAVGVPCLYGVRIGLGEFRREAAAALAWLCLAAGAVVVLGIDKPRYLHPTQWVPLLFFAVGLARGLEGLADRAFARRHGRALAAAALALAALALGAALRAVPGPLAGGVLVLEVGLAAGFLALALQRAGPARLAAGLAGLCILVPILGGAGARTGAQLAHVRTHRLAAAPAAAWLDANLGPAEAVATLHVSQVLWASSLDPAQVVGFGSFEADDLPGLREEMRRRGVSHAVYTWRAPARTASQRDYDRRKKVPLAALFRGGGPVAGFEHLATLPPPAGLEDQAPAQVYRLAP